MNVCIHMFGRMDGWMDGCLIDRCLIDGWMNGWIVWLVDGWMVE